MRAEVENFSTANTQLTTFQKSIQKTSQTVAQSASQTSKSGALFASASKSISQLGQSALGSIPGIGGMAQNLLSAGSAGGSLTAGLGAALPVIGGLAVAIGGATLALKLFYSAGKRGAEIENTLKAFGNSVAILGDSTKTLNALREQTRGTVSDVELMRLSIAALQGTSEEFRKVVGPNLGKVFDVAARAARATGQSAEIVREKFLLGLRRQSKLLLDDIGVMVDATKAQAAYAKQLGKTADQLNDLEKQAAFAQEAINQLDKIGAEAGMNTTAESLAKINVLFQNLGDRFSLAIAPVFGAFVAVLAKIADGLNVLLDLGSSLVGHFIAEVKTLVGNFVELKDALFGGVGGVNYFREALTYAVAASTLLADTIAAISTTIKNTLLPVFNAIGGSISAFFGGINKNISLNLSDLAFLMGKGGGNIIGSFAAGLARGGTYVLQAVTKIAQIVADFLMGFSPPRMGPLKEIDKGGENVAMAWADGFVSGILKPVEQVAKEVNDRLGVIATFTRDQVATRFAVLDAAIMPFKESLAIAKADMEAIAGFVDPALRSVERQRKGILKQFNLGTGQGDIDALRNFDAQAARLNELKEIGAERNDQAEIQLGLASAMQAQERALLAIQQARLGEAEKITDTEGKGAKELADGVAKAEKALKGGGGGAGEPAAAGAQPFMGGAAPDLLSSGAVDAARAQIQAVLGSGAAGIASGLADSGAAGAIAGLGAQAGELQNQLGRIQKSNPVQSLLKKFDGLKNSVTDVFEPFKEAVSKVFEELFGEGGKIAGFLNTANTLFDNTFVKEGSAFQIAKGAFTSFKDEADRIFKAAFGSEGTITGFLSGVGDKFDDIFSTDNSPLTLATESFTTLKDTLSEGFENFFDFIPDLDVGAMADQVSELVGDVLDTVKIRMDALNTNEKFISIQGTIQTQFSTLFDTLKTLDIEGIVQPFTDVLNGIKNAIDDFPTDVIDKAGDIISTISGGLSSLFGGGGGGGDTAQTDAPEENIRNLLAGLTIGLPQDVKDELGVLGESITSAISLGMINETSLATVTTTLGTLTESFRTNLQAAFEGENNPLSVATMAMDSFVVTMSDQFTTLKNNIDTSLLGMADSFRALFESPEGIIQRLPSLTQLSMDGIINQFLRLTNEGDGTLKSALATLGDVLNNTVSIPAQRTMQRFVDAFVSGINALIRSYNESFAAATQGQLDYFPSFNIPAAAKGALNLKGTFLAGERGAELITTKRPATVFPANATRALAALAAQPQAMPIYGGGDTNYSTSNNSVNSTINVANPRQAVLTQRQQLAALRR